MSLPAAGELATLARGALERIGVATGLVTGPDAVTSPINGQPIARVTHATAGDVDEAVRRAARAFQEWRLTPAPVRGTLVKRLGELLTQHSGDLATLVSLEVGKITSEARGEVQEMIDVCDFAVGLSRQLHGRTMPSERPGHRLAETWHPLGVTGIITAFNFPVAVWSWNTAIALACGDPVIWKPSEQAPLTALASAALLERACQQVQAPKHLSQVLLGGADVGMALAEHPGVALVSATGSTRMGRQVGPRVAARFGRSLLELGGNNAAVIAPSADLGLAARGIIFAAAGTAGQRCTTLRRVIAHESVIEELTGRLMDAYSRLPIGNPLASGTLVGPLIGDRAWKSMRDALGAASDQGGELVAGGGRRLADEAPGAFYAEPALVRMPGQTAIVTQETFAPILYVLPYTELAEAIEVNNAVAQGLSSSIFTRDQAEAEIFTSAAGSDCGIVNVNIGTSGAEIGGAFGGEKETGGGRESGSDAWRAYMRRTTATVNYSGQLPLAQGVEFAL
jgi:aldehyde dehydrogenase (NAD+)